MKFTRRKRGGNRNSPEPNTILYPLSHFFPEVVSEVEYDAMNTDEKYTFERKALNASKLILNHLYTISMANKPARVYYVNMYMYINYFMQNVVLTNLNYYTKLRHKLNVLKVDTNSTEELLATCDKIEKVLEKVENRNPILKLVNENNIAELNTKLAEVRQQIETSGMVLYKFFYGNDAIFDIMVKARANMHKMPYENIVNMIDISFDKTKFTERYKAVCVTLGGAVLYPIFRNENVETLKYLLSTIPDYMNISDSSIHDIDNHPITGKIVLKYILDNDMPIQPHTYTYVFMIADWIQRNEPSWLSLYLKRIKHMCDAYLYKDCSPEVFLEYVKAIIANNCYTSQAILKGVVKRGLVEPLRVLLETGKFKEMIEDVIDDAPNNDVRELLEKYGGRTMWEGWSRADADQFDFLFSEEGAINHSVCPVCLKYIERKDGCLYMSHDCAVLPGFYHKRLYEMYAWSADHNDNNENENDNENENQEGGAGRKITWCTDCGRICYGHQHYELGSANATIKPPKLKYGDPFEKDCRKTNGGGGYPEKIARYRRAREYALELQEDIGKLRQRQALQDLVEQIWNAPLYKTRIVQHIIEKKQWNIPREKFPLPKSNTSNNAPNLPFSGELPIIHSTETNNIYNAFMIGDVDIIQFQHKMENGEWNRHEGKGRHISRAAFRGFLHDVLGTPGKLGKCWQFYTSEELVDLSANDRKNLCTATLHPEEVKAALDMTNEDDIKLYESYRKQFNRKYKNM